MKGKYKGYFNVKKTSYNGILFDSEYEAEFYKKCQSDLSSGKISDFHYHPTPFGLCNFVSKEYNDNLIKHSYTPDFIIYTKEKVFIIDIKAQFLHYDGTLKRDWFLEKLANSNLIENYFGNKVPVSFVELTKDEDGGLSVESFNLKKKAKRKAVREYSAQQYKKLVELATKTIKDYNGTGIVNWEYFEEFYKNTDRKMLTRYNLGKGTLYKTKNKLIKELLNNWKGIGPRNKKTKQNKIFESLKSISKIKEKSNE